MEDYRSEARIIESGMEKLGKGIGKGIEAGLKSIAGSIDRLVDKMNEEE